MRLLQYSLVALLVVAAPNLHAQDQDLRITSWNIQRLGENQKDMQAVAQVAQHTDFLAVQELMTEGALKDLEQNLESLSGETWSSIQSAALGRGHYQEHYGFIWRDQSVSYVDGAVVYTDPGDRFEREPFSAHFKDRLSGADFAIGTVHVLYGKDESQRAPEIKSLADYWGFLTSTYSDTRNVLLTGDFNTTPDNSAWSPLFAVARPLIVKGASTLSTKDGSFAHLYDNIIVGKDTGVSAVKMGVFNYPKMLGWTHVRARQWVSDHAPVMVVARLDTSPPERSAPESTTFVAPAALHAAATEGNSIVRGNRRSMIYHLPGCASYEKVGASNLQAFLTENEAMASGYRIAKDCH